MSGAQLDGPVGQLGVLERPSDVALLAAERPGLLVCHDERAFVLPEYEKPIAHVT